MFDVTRPPVPDICSAPFWQAASAHRLLIQRCPQTGRHQWYPRAHSVHAPDAIPEWVTASGRGRVYAHTTIHRGGTQRAPYTCVLIALDEGPLMLTRWHPQAGTEPSIDMPVKVGFVEISNTLTLPVFMPQES